MKIFITGANGYLGAKILEYLSPFSEFKIKGGYFGANTDPRLVLLDISDRDQVQKVFNEHKPDVVIHTAAVAHGEDSGNEALLQKVNVQGTQNVVDAAKSVKARLVFISSIGALHNIPYGKSKLKGEKIIKAAGIEHLIIRPSVIIGGSPSKASDLTFNNILKAIKDKKTLTEDSEWKFQPTWIEHICEIIKLWLEGKFRDKEPVYPIMPEVKSRFEISNDILQSFGLKAVSNRQPRYGESTVLTIDSLVKNDLPVYHYDFVLERIISEIKRLF